MGVLLVEVGRVAHDPDADAIDLHQREARLRAAPEGAGMDQTVFVHPVQGVEDAPDAGVAVVVVAHNHQIEARVSNRLEIDRRRVEMRPTLYGGLLGHIGRALAEHGLQVADHQIRLGEDRLHIVEAPAEIVTVLSAGRLLLPGLAQEITGQHQHGGVAGVLRSAPEPIRAKAVRGFGNRSAGLLRRPVKRRVVRGRGLIAENRLLDVEGLRLRHGLRRRGSFRLRRKERDHRFLRQLRKPGLGGGGDALREIVRGGGDGLRGRDRGLLSQTAGGPEQKQKREEQNGETEASGLLEDGSHGSFVHNSEIRMENGERINNELIYYTRFLRPRQSE